MAAVFLAVFFGHFAYGITTSFDSRYVPHVAMSIVRRHTTRLDAYPAIAPTDDAVRIAPDGHVYSFFPIGTPLLATPFVAAIDWLSSRLFTFESSGFIVPFDLDLYLARGRALGVERFIAAIFTALASALIYLLARESLSSRARCLVVVFVFAFATPMWSTASRALWQHGPSALLLAATLLLLVRARERPRLAALAALPLAFSYVVRPTNAISIAVFTLYVFLEHRREVVLYLALAATVAVPFFAYNLSVDGALVPPYYRSENLVLSRAVLDALPGHWISPSRGVLVFSPVLAFAFVGARERLRAGTRLDRYVFAVIVLHWLAVSAGRHWCADNCFGNRYFCDVMPCFMWFLIPAVQRVARSHVLIVVFALSTGVSFAIHRRGVTSWDVYNWNRTPVYIERATARVWDLGDIQFLRGM